MAIDMEVGDTALIHFIPLSLSNSPLISISFLNLRFSPFLPPILISTFLPSPFFPFSISPSPILLRALKFNENVCRTSLAFCTLLLTMHNQCSSLCLSVRGQPTSGVEISFEESKALSINEHITRDPNKKEDNKKATENSLENNWLHIEDSFASAYYIVK